MTFSHVDPCPHGHRATGRENVHHTSLLVLHRHCHPCQKARRWHRRGAAASPRLPESERLKQKPLRTRLRAILPDPSDTTLQMRKHPERSSQLPGVTQHTHATLTHPAQPQAGPHPGSPHSRDHSRPTEVPRNLRVSWMDNMVTSHCDSLPGQG